MDPITIAATAVGIVKGCYQVIATVYTLTDDTRNVDTNVDDLLREIQGLSRSAESIGSAWNQNPMIITAQAGHQRNLWSSVGTSLEDCQITLARLNNKLDELKKGSLFGRGFLRKPTKMVMLNMRLKDIVAFKQQIQSYNSAIQSALIMINVCLSMNSNSSQEFVVQILGGLKNQIGHLRTETARQGQLISGFASPELAQDNRRMTQNLESLIHEAEVLHSSASTVVSDSRSTVWGGSVMGDPLSDEQHSTIHNWIPPPAISEEQEEEEEPESSRPGPSGSTFMDSAIGDSLDQDSDADSDIERDLMKRYQEVAFTSFEQKDYVKAESFLRKVIEMSADIESHEDEMTEVNLMLAFSCGLQSQWKEAETLLLPIAMTKGIIDPRAFHGLQALALFHLAIGDHETAIKYCKRAIGGFRKVLGKTSAEYYDSMEVLARIFDQKGDPTSAEGCRTFLPLGYNEKLVVDPEVYLSATLSAIQQKSEQPAQNQGGPIPPPLGATSSQSLPLTRDVTGSTPMSPSNLHAPGLGAVTDAVESLRIGPTRTQSYPDTGTTAPPQMRKPRLWVSVEFGVIEAAVAFGLLEEDGRLSKRGLITEWPGMPKPNSRVPCVVYYDEKSNVVGWGFDIGNALAPNGYPKSGVLKCQWFQMALIQGSDSYMDAVNLPPPPAGKSSHDVVEDFLFRLHVNIRHQLRRELGDAYSLQEDQIYYCFTRPPVWTPAVEKSFRAAIGRAGFIKHESEAHRVNFLIEGDAAAVYCLDQNVISLNREEVVLVVDCGGGTVNLMAYKLVEKSSFYFDAFTASTGDSCGSTATNRNFSNILRAKIREMGFENTSRTAGRIYAKCIMDFEHRIRHDFRNSQPKWAVDVDVEVEFPDLGLEEGYMIFTNAEILQCFDPVVNAVLDLVKVQIAKIRALNGNLQCILVTGTWAKSEYLFDQIKNSSPPELRSKIIRPDDPTTASVQGTLIAAYSQWHLTTPALGVAPSLPTFPTLTCSSETYLLELPIEIKSKVHQESGDCSMYHCLDGKDRRYDIATVVLNKGQCLNTFTPLRFTAHKFLMKNYDGREEKFGYSIYSKSDIVNQPSILVDHDCSIEAKISVALPRSQFVIKAFKELPGSYGNMIWYMAEYEIGIDAHFPANPSLDPRWALVVTTVFKGVEVDRETVCIETEPGA